MVFRGVAFLLSLAFASAANAQISKISRDPYLGAIVVDAKSGKVLFEDNADGRGYPASVTKLMTFAVVMDRIANGQLNLQAPVSVTAEAARTGGSQVYLKQGEVFSVHDLVVALMVSSANDAAVALAIHVAGSKAAFVKLMNAKAKELGMTDTIFHSPHGLPPSRGQQPDVTTARDLATLSRHLVQHGRVLDYSSIKVDMLREGTGNPFEMRNHNHLLGKLAGCDGLKTGYFSAGGFSLSATVERHGRRVISVILGSVASKTRDLKTMELVENAFAKLGSSPTPGSGGANDDIPTIKTERTPPPSSTREEPAVIFRVIPPPKKS